MSAECVLCGTNQFYPLIVANKCYYRCQCCQLVWLDSAYHIDEEQEKAVYDGHQNDSADEHYRHFLMRAFGEVLTRVLPPAKGLDFGCGPGPALVAMGQEHGYQILGYDKFYAPNPALLQQLYDFITSTEVVEHLSAPRTVLDHLWQQLKPGGYLVLQTQRVLSDERFSQWRYRHDPTHVSFFASESFQWLAKHWQASLSLPHHDVAVFGKALS